MKLGESPQPKPPLYLPSYFKCGIAVIKNEKSEIIMD
jgi:hypothetical protein